MKDKKENVVVYARRYIRKTYQCKYDELTPQIDMGIEYCLECDYHIVEVFSDDRYSGNTFKRPGLAALEELIKDGKEIDLIVVANRDRIFSDKPVYSEISDYFPFEGVEIDCIEK